MRELLLRLLEGIVQKFYTREEEEEDEALVWIEKNLPVLNRRLKKYRLKNQLGSQD